MSRIPRSCPTVSHSDHDTCILVPAHQRVVTVLRTRLCNIRSARHEILVCVCARKLACDGCVHGLHDLEVGGEEDIEVALVNLELVRRSIQHVGKITYQRRGDRNHLPLVPRLHDRRIDTPNCLTQLVEVGADELVVGELGCEYVEELHQPCGDILWLAEIRAEWY